MKTITEMKEEVKTLLQNLADARTRCIQENRDPSADERKNAAEVMNRIEELEAIISLEEREAEIKARIGKSESPPIKPEITGKDPQMEKDKFESAGEFFLAVMRAASPQPYIDPRLRVSMRNAATGLQEGIPSDGGFLVQQEFASELLARAYQTGQVASRCRRIPVGTNANGLKIPGIDETSRATGSRWGGVRAYWLGEADEKIASKPKFRMIELNLKKMIGLCYATDELLQDATALAAIISQAFSEEFGFMLDDGVINGTGAGMPMGIMNSPCIVQVNKETGQLAATVVYENIVNMWSRCYAKSRTNAVWLINQDVEPQLFTMGIVVGTGGSPVYMPPGGASAAPYGTLFGRPVIPIEQCQTLGTAGDIILGDFSQYLLIDKGAMQTAQSIHVRFVYDESVFRFVYRVDGQPLWNATLTPFKGSNTLSPFVRLQTRS